MNALEHRETAQEFLAMADEEFAEGKTRQASEKLWSAAAHAVMSIAQQRGWDCDNHRQLVECVNRICEETGDAHIWAEFGAARQFHANFYHDFLEDYEIEMLRPPAAEFINRLTAMHEVKSAGKGIAMPNLPHTNERIRQKIAGASRKLADAKPISGGMATGRKALAEIDASALTRRVRGGLRSARAGIGRTRAISPKEQIAALSSALHQVVDNVSYADLSADLQKKFKTAGLRSGQRRPGKAADFYDSSIPGAVKLSGEDAVWDFIDGKNGSHIESVANSPELARNNSNIVWEDIDANYARGAANMTRLEQLNVRLDNRFDAFRINAVRIVPRAVFYSIVIEASISIVENGIYVYRGKKDTSTAMRDASLNVAKSGVVGALAGVTVAGAAAVGLAPVIATAAPALGIIGGGLLVYSAAGRIHTAVTSPLDEQSGPAHTAAPLGEPMGIWRNDDGVWVVAETGIRYHNWRTDASDDALLAPLNQQLAMLNALKDELTDQLAKSIPTYDGRELLKQPE